MPTLPAGPLRGLPVQQPFTDQTEPAVIAQLAMEEQDIGSLRHQCASEVTLGDTWQPVHIDGAPTMTSHPR